MPQVQSLTVMQGEGYSLEVRDLAMPSALGTTSAWECASSNFTDFRLLPAYYPTFYENVIPPSGSHRHHASRPHR